MPIALAWLRLAANELDEKIYGYRFQLNSHHLKCSRSLVAAAPIYQHPQITERACSMRVAVHALIGFGCVASAIVCAQSGWCSALAGLPCGWPAAPTRLDRFICRDLNSKCSRTERRTSAWSPGALSAFDGSGMVANGERALLHYRMQNNTQSDGRVTNWVYIFAVYFIRS